MRVSAAYPTLLGMLQMLGLLRCRPCPRDDCLNASALLPPSPNLSSPLDPKAAGASKSNAHLSHSPHHL